MATGIPLLTAEQFAELTNIEGPCELVRGKVVVSPPLSFNSGHLCATVIRAVGGYVRANGLGMVVGSGAGVVTERDPDTVRGADVAFYSYQAVPKGTRPQPYAANPPELVFEVRSPSQSWPEVHKKVAEYLEAGVQTVCVVDGPSQKVVVHYADRPSETLDAGQSLRRPEILGDLAVAVGDLLD
ncbi:Uma2 family endonuclease [Botrimarina sp.]|uniref:Uma2 family endonuclease n=1 Tax=Botrimarina sp. TaxID=2795802 RepID=UPI0032EDDED4